MDFYYSSIEAATASNPSAPALRRRPSAPVAEAVTADSLCPEPSSLIPAVAEAAVVRHSARRWTQKGRLKLVLAEQDLALSY